ncbi:glycoside hydrolase family 3 [Mucilaginibacter sp. HMF5004]|uniref:glycoside hydrolase family 3 protein n=1 Tax=Mucilaginibacter rivuli TaxID=2857527 RepID=UPI001C5FCDF9|nr:glycoside hydrolase family 3 N-terminal domain-containing protein [Mucilaginibacter rivuli]MBW4888331.1 glycoside hydrolase family 3 [Mucilaginibacter rivuli]
MKANGKALVIILFLWAAFAGGAWAQQSFIQSLNQQNHWVDSVFNRLTKRQKIAQLFMVRAHTNLSRRYQDSVGQVIKHQHLGGIVFFQGGPVREATLINKYQRLAKVPLLIAMDGEWGLGMRLDSTISYPYQMTLGAIQDNTLIYKMGQQVAQDLKRLGLQMNFGPDMDVNNNPNNPVIGFRSFGDNKYNVAEKGIAYMKGMQDAGILTTAKHFPGHGDTDVDSHFDLPQLPFTRQRLDSLEEYPFREAIKAGISGVMVAHMSIPALDNTAHLPSTLSKPIITGILRDSLGFKGLIVSDAMGMKGVVKYFPDGEADVKAFIAGNDILELSENSRRAIHKIKKAIRQGLIPMSDLDARVKKVLAAKYWAGLNNVKDIRTENLIADLNRPEAKALVQQLTDAAITCLKNDYTIIADDLTKKTAIISIGTADTTLYQRELQKSFTHSTLFSLSKTASAQKIDSLRQALKAYDKVIIGVHDTRIRPQSKLDFSNEVKLVITELAAQPNAVISVFANPYTLAGLPGIENSSLLLMGYQKSDEMQRSAVKVILGQLKPTGKLPVNVNVFFGYGTGF